MTRILFVLLLVLGLLALLLFVRLWSGPGSYPYIWKFQQQIETQNMANDQQAERNRQLEMDVAGLARDDEAIEDHARSELGMIKEGETFYQVILKSDPHSVPVPLPQPGTVIHVE